MSKHLRPFKFKQSEVSHHRSSMKVGIDAVILGAWAEVTGARKVLDVGCGCGVISLIVAQRNPKAMIEGIDIHPDSVAEASENFRVSSWSDRLCARIIDFMEFCKLSPQNSVDYIISNPPYFKSGIGSPETTREKARHQAELSPEIILYGGSRILAPGGTIGLVVPYDQGESLTQFAESSGLYLNRRMTMTGKEGNEPKRSFLEFSPEPADIVRLENMTLQDTAGNYTPEYQSLCRDLYLKF